MAGSSIDKSKEIEKQTPARQHDSNKIGSLGHQAASGAGDDIPSLNSAAVTRIQLSPQSAPRSDMLALQRSIGNRAVAAMVRGDGDDVAIQAKLEVGPVHDVYEQEADRVARLVTSGITQRKPAGNVKSRDEERGEGMPGPAFNIKRMVQRKSAASENGVRVDGSFAANANVQQRIRRMEQGGRPLSDSVRRQMEPGFGADLSEVRVHTGGDAVQLSRDIGARAFTHGSHIAFASGQYNPDSQGGLSLLAHELTHTIQQTGAHPLAPVQRSFKSTSGRGPKSVIQRIPMMEKVKRLWNRSKIEAAPPIDWSVEGAPVQIQASAKDRAKAALNEAPTLIATARVLADQKLKGAGDTTDDMTGAKKYMQGTDVGISKKGKSGSYRAGKRAIKGVEAGDQERTKFLRNVTKGLEEIPAKLQRNYIAIMMVNEDVNGPIKLVSGMNETAYRKKNALQSHAYAKESEALVQSIRTQTTQMGTKADVAASVKSAGLDSWSNFNKSSSIPAAEKSASDSILTLMNMQDKIEGHVEYLTHDFEVLKGYLASKGDSMTQTHSSGAAMRAIGSGTERSSVDKPESLDQQEAYLVGGGKRNMMGIQTPGGGATDEAEVRNAEYEAGKLQGRRVQDDKAAKGSPPKVEKPVVKVNKLSKSEKGFADKVKAMELTAMLYAKAEKRLPVATSAFTEIRALHDQATALYEGINAKRSATQNKKPTESDTDQAVIAAGEARKKVAQGTILLQKTHELKKQVYDESQNKAYKELVGERAMSSTKRMAKQLGGIVANGAARALTLGFYGYQAESEHGGYRTAIKKRTILDDIVRKNEELNQIVQGVKKGNVRGLGGAKGVRHYVRFKAIAFALQIIRDIAASVALWVTIITAGVGAPVGAAFATIALFAGLAKGVIDLLLFMWSGAGLMNTNDPRSRAILRSENRGHMMAMGEAVFAGASAGAIMGLSGNTGLLGAHQQTSAFGTDSVLAQAGNVGVGPVVPLVGGIGQGVLASNLSRYNTEAEGSGNKANKKVDQIRKAHGAMRVLSHPVSSAIKSLSEFMSKKKRLREGKFAAVLPTLGKNIRTLEQSVQEVPVAEGGHARNPGGLPPPPPN